MRLQTPTERFQEWRKRTGLSETLITKHFETLHDSHRDGESPAKAAEWVRALEKAGR